MASPFPDSDNATIRNTTNPIPTTTTTTPTLTSFTTGNSTKPYTDPGGTKVPVGAIVGGVIGIIVALLVVFIIIIFVIRRRRSRSKEKDDDDTPQPLPKLDAYGRVDPGDEHPGNVSGSSPAPASPGMYEDPNQPLTKVVIKNKASLQNSYANMPPKDDSSTGAYVVPMDHAPRSSAPNTLAPGFRGEVNAGFDWQGSGTGTVDEGDYMPMDVCDPDNPTAGEEVGGGSSNIACNQPPSPFHHSPGSPVYVNIPGQEMKSGRAKSEKPGVQQEVRRSGGRENVSVGEHYYGNVDLPDLTEDAGKSWSGRPSTPTDSVSPNHASSLSLRPENGVHLKAAPTPSPKPSPRPATKPLLKPSPKILPKPSPKLLPKPSPSGLTRPFPGLGIHSLLTSAPDLNSDTESEGENYEYMEAPEKDYVNSPDRVRDNTNARDKVGDYVNASDEASDYMNEPEMEYVNAPEKKRE